MKLYLQRHAEAESGMQMDPTRKLTDTGKRQAKMMGKWLARQDTPRPQILLQSNFQRSKSTAKRMGKQLDLEPITCGWLDPENDPELVWPRIKALAKEHGAKAVLAVTHGPLVEKLFSYLTSGHAPQYFTFAHGAIAHFDTTAPMHEAAGDYTYDEQEVKRLILGDGGASGNCDYCEDAADRGWIDMDDVFEGPDGDVDEPPIHPHCTCEVEQKTRRVRVYESGRRESVMEDGPFAYLHWLVTPNTVARDEDEMDLVTSDARKAVEAAVQAVTLILEDVIA